MRKLIAILLALVTSAVSSPAPTLIVSKAPVNSIATPSSCSSFQDATTASVNVWPIKNIANNTYITQALWTDGSARTICQISMKMSKTLGSITGKTYQVEIWNSSKTTLYTSAGVTGSDSWSGTMVDFTFTAASLSASTQYFFAITENGSADASNYASVFTTITSVIPGTFIIYDGSKNYVNDFSTVDIQLVLYAQ